MTGSGCASRESARANQPGQALLGAVKAYPADEKQSAISKGFSDEVNAGRWHALSDVIFSC
jgi:hypothetical protein